MRTGPAAGLRRKGLGVSARDGLTISRAGPVSETFGPLTGLPSSGWGRRSDRDIGVAQDPLQGEPGLAEPLPQFVRRDAELPASRSLGHPVEPAEFDRAPQVPRELLESLADGGGFRPSVALGFPRLKLARQRPLALRPAGLAPKVVQGPPAGDRVRETERLPDLLPGLDPWPWPGAGPRVGTPERRRPGQRLAECRAWPPPATGSACRSVPNNSSRRSLVSIRCRDRMLSGRSKRQTRPGKTGHVNSRVWGLLPAGRDIADEGAKLARPGDRPQRNFWPW
jgi:hypothetical protein